MIEQGRRISGQSPAEDVHRLRIELKLLRYTAEFFGDMFGRDLDRLIDRTRRLQDMLGQFNDACVAGVCVCNSDSNGCSR